MPEPCSNSLGRETGDASSSLRPKRKLLILSINARSICNKFDSFVSLVAYYNPAIVAVTETWLRPDIPGIFVKGYSCFRSDRPFGLGGGTLLLIQSSFSLPKFLSRAPAKTFFVILHGALYRLPKISLFLLAVFTALLPVILTIINL